MKTFVVTGGAGFIGSNLAAALDARGDGVVVIDSLGDKDKWRNLSKRRLLDIVPPEGMFEALEHVKTGLSGIFHMAAISDTTETDVDRIIDTNFRMSCRLWTWCARHGVPMVYASSAATYGDGAAGFADRQDEAYLAGLRPLNPYGWSKNLFDRWVCHQIGSGQPSPASWAGLKFFNVFGPNDAHKGAQRSVALQVYESLATGIPVRLFKSHRPDYPDGGQLRDFIWVDDCVGIALWLMDQPGHNGLFNVGTGVARSFNDLVAAVGVAANVRPVIEYIAMPESLRPKYQSFTQAETGKLQASGCPVTSASLEEGIRRYVQDHLMTSDSWR
jgi:ADP-L-glycero-D-manno-heptose 6-epimerase